MTGMFSARVNRSKLIFFFFNGTLLMKGFGTLIASLSKVDPNMIQTRTEKIFSRT